MDNSVVIAGGGIKGLNGNGKDTIKIFFKRVTRGSQERAVPQSLGKRN